MYSMNTNQRILYFLWSKYPTRSYNASFFYISRSHTIRHTYTPARTPLYDGSASRRGRYLYSTLQTQNTNTHSSAGFEPAIPVIERQQTQDLDGTAIGIAKEVLIKLLKPTGHVMHQQFNIQQLYVLPTLYLCVLYLSENKQRLVPITA